MRRRKEVNAQRHTWSDTLRFWDGGASHCTCLLLSFLLEENVWNLFVNMQVCYPSQRTEQGSHTPTPPTPASFSHDDRSVSRQGCWNPSEEIGNHQIRWTSRLHRSWGFPGSSDGKESAGNAGDPASIPESVRSPGEADSYSLQCSCLENSTDRGAWRATIHGIAKSQTRLSH